VLALVLVLAAPACEIRRMLRALLVVMMCASPALAKDVVAPTGVLDFDLVEHDGSFILRSNAYAITFPSKPVVQQKWFDVGTTKAEGMMAYVLTPTGSYAISVRPMPRNRPIGPKLDLDGVRDGLLSGSGAKLTSEAAARVVGVDGRRVRAIATEDGKPQYIEAEMLWDREHRTTIALISVERGRERSAAARRFVDSFAITPGARGPLDEAPLRTGPNNRKRPFSFPVLGSLFPIHLVARGACANSEQGNREPGTVISRTGS
jgi:hypothetical protein